MRRGRPKKVDEPLGNPTAHDRHRESQRGSLELLAKIKHMTEPKRLKRRLDRWERRKYA